MKTIWGKAVKIFASATLALSAVIGYAKENLDWNYKAMTAGRAKLEGVGYVNRVALGKPNFSPEFAMTLELVYDSSATGIGLFGSVWRCPQLESRLLPQSDGAEWITPWGEKIRFYNREQLKKQAEKNKDGVVLFKEELSGKGCFAPYSDWEADSSNKDWRVTGKEKYAGWTFEYRKTRLTEITAPGERKLIFSYNGDGILENVTQNGVKFIDVKSNKTGLAESVAVNGVATSLSYRTLKALILQQELLGTSQTVTRIMLTGVRTADLAATTFAYTDQGYLTVVARGNFTDKITVDQETPADRLNWLKTVTATINAKKSTRNLVRNKISGRILADDQFKYAYPARETVQVTNGDGAKNVYNYSGERGILTITDANGNTTKIYYYRRFDVAYNGKVRQIRDAKDRVAVSYKYDKKTGELLRATDLAGNETYFTYDKRGLLALISRSEEDNDERPFLKFKHNQLGLPTETALLDTDGKPAAVFKANYTQTGDLSSLNGPELHLTIRANEFGRPVSLTDTLGRTITKKYDKFNRLSSTTDAFGVTTEISYNAAGLPVEAKRYDTPQKQNLLSSIALTYDQLGNVAAITDDQGRTKKLDRNAMGRVVAEYFPDGTAAKYQLNAAGKITEVTDPNGHKIGFSWNPLGKMASTLTAAGQQTTFTYDKYGLLTGLDKSFTDGKSGGQQIAYAYDQYDRLKNIDFGDNRSQALKHDRRGKTTSVDAVDGATVKHMELEYTQFDQLAAKTVTETKAGKTVSALKYEYTYNAAGKRTGLVVNMGAGTRELSWNYDELGRLTEQKDGSKVVTYRYNNKSQLVEQNIGGIPVSYTYTALGQLESKVMGNKDKPIASLKYEYAKDGQIVARTVNGVRQAYEYDKKGQLLSVKDSTGIVEAYVYDAAGNILKKTVNGKTTTFEYDSANQLTKATLPDGTVKDYAYDAAGRMVKDGNKALSYGWFNKVMNISENGKTVADYDYTVDGQLSKSNVSGKEESFVWDDLALIQRNSTELTNEPYVTGGNPIMADNKALFNDMLGSTLGVAANGSYSPINRTSFGETSDNSDCNFFTGKPNVAGLGYAFLFRNYNANNGKWTTQDPDGYPDGWNNFSYINNQVTDCIDLQGETLYEVGKSYMIGYDYRAAADKVTPLDPIWKNVGSPYQSGGHWYQKKKEYTRVSVQPRREVLEIYATFVGYDAETGKPLFQNPTTKATGIYENVGNPTIKETDTGIVKPFLIE